MNFLDPIVFGSKNPRVSRTVQIQPQELYELKDAKVVSAFQVLKDNALYSL